MPLQCDLFTKPTPNARLNQCLVDDSKHLQFVPGRPREKGVHVSLVQSALFTVLPAVDFGDELTSEEYGPLTAAAVFRFKDTRTPKILNAALAQTKPDDIVGKQTIAALDREMLARQGKQAPAAKIKVIAVRQSGFSDLRLRRTGGNQFAVDADQPLVQMVPVGGIRNLQVSTGRQGDRIGLSIPSPAHSQAFVAPGIVTVRGISAGEDAANFTLSGAAAEPLRIIVRAASTITLHMHALTGSGKGATGFEGRLDTLIQQLNGLYGPQANLRFTGGQFRTIDTLDGKRIDFDAPIFINGRTRIPPAPVPGRQLFTVASFTPLAINALNDINLFVTPQLSDTGNAKAAGTSSIFAERLCWGKAELMRDDQVAGKLVGHEIGHLLGLAHLDFLRGALMFPALQGGGGLIPPETLETLKP